MFKNPFEKKITESSFNDEKKKEVEASEARKKEMISLDLLTEDEKNKIYNLQNIVEEVFDKKNELKYIFNSIKDYLPHDNHNKSPEKIWKKLHQSKSDKGEDVSLSGDQVLELLADRADLIIKQKIKSNGELINNYEKDKIYEIEMKNAYSNIIRFQSLIEEIEKYDNYYERASKYDKAKTSNEKDGVWKELPEDLKVIAKFKNFSLKEFVSAKNRSDILKNDIKASEFLIDRYRSEGADQGLISAAYRDLQESIKKYEEEIKNSRDLYFYECLQRLEEARNVIDSKGSIIETPYVKSKLSMIDSFGDRPVFIHGELGSGKTELVKHACRMKYSLIYLENVWDKENPQPDSQEEIKNWEKSRREAAEPLVVSGHKNIDISDFFGAKEMSAQESLPPKELAGLIEKNINNLKEERKSQGKELSVSEERDLRDIYKENFKNPIEVKTVIGLFYRAMKEGRPIILDEINAIPHTALIALNDLLTLKKGDLVTPFISGIKPFKVADGFKVFATGNWKPEDGKAYFGRQGLDAAFLSRFGVVSYDYLPQRTIGLSENSDYEANRKERSENELFYIMVSSLLDNNLSLHLPEGSIEKISALASASRIIQNIFSEKEEGEMEFDWRSANKKIKQKEIIKENVLSIRHLIPILRNWKSDGFKHELEEYILKDYLDRSQYARNSEKILLYRLMQNIHGGVLFSESKGWPSSIGVEGEREVVNLSPENRLFHYDSITNSKSSKSILDKSIKIESIPTRRVIEILFGRIPDRSYVDKSILHNKEEISGSVDDDHVRDHELAQGKIKEMLDDIKLKGFVFDKDDKLIMQKINKVIG